MKKKILFILLVVGIILFNSCNLNIEPDSDYGIIKVNLANGNSRGIGSDGLPILDAKNISVAIYNKNNVVLASGAANSVLKVPIGIEVVIKVSVLEPAAVWIGEAKYTVMKGENKVIVPISKTPKRFPSLLYQFEAKNARTGDFSLKLENGKELYTASDIENGSTQLITRDKMGNVYCWDNPTGNAVLKIWKADGTSLVGDIYGKSFKFLKSDMATGRVYGASGGMSGSSLDEIKPLSPSQTESITYPAGIPQIESIDQIAVYNDILFVYYFDGGTFKISAYKIEQGSAAGYGINGTALASIEVDAEPSTISDMYADETGIYLLFNSKREIPQARIVTGGVQKVVEPMHSVGMLRKFYYDGKNIIEKGFFGAKQEKLKSTILFENVSNETAMIQTKDNYFYGPEKFIGKDEAGNLYISDNGFKIKILGGKPRIVANINRIAKFDTVGGNLSFSDANTKWSKEYPVWKWSKTMLVWDKGNDPSAPAYRYWNAKTGDEEFSDENKLLVGTSSGVSGATYADVFCYDQDGNFYILKGSEVEMYAFKNGKYNAPKQGLLALKCDSAVSGQRTSHIAVDFSSVVPEKNRIYFALKKGYGQPTDIMYQDFLYDHADGKYSASDLDSAKTVVTFADGSGVTALAAGKAGVFVAVKTQESGHPNKYSINIYKYNRDGSAAGSVNIAKDVEIIPTDKDYVDELITDMQIIGNSLYVLYNKTIGANASDHMATKATIGGRILKIANITNDISKADTLWEKAPSEEGIAPYRFIAIKPKKLVIASDGFYGNKDAETKYEQKNKVLTFDLQNKLMLKQDAKAEFSKTLTFEPGSGIFYW